MNEASVAANSAANFDAATRPIRGSSLLLSGRLLSLGLTYLAQVLVVRGLTKADYGAWMYSLSVVALFQSVAALGLDSALTRFVSIYREQGDYPRLAGTIVLVAGTVLAMSAVVIVGFFALAPTVAPIARVSDDALLVLGVLIFQVPLDILDALMAGLFACLGRARAIFFRRYVLAPALKLALAGALVVAGAELMLLAIGWVATSLIGLAVYGRQLWRELRATGWFSTGPSSRVILPARDLFGYALPLLAADVSTAVAASIGALALGYYSDLSHVATFAAAVPLAMLNQLVMRNFAVLYTPAASQLYARKDYAAINDLYWRTAVWVAVLTFPLFALTFSVSTSVVDLLYGSRYDDAGIVLALMAVGHYVNAALGFNGATLRVMNKVGYVVSISATAAVASVVLSWWLVPRYGAVGAGAAVAVTMVLHNVMKQLGLRQVTGISLFDARYSFLYTSIVLWSVVLLGGQRMLPDQPTLLITLSAIASVALLMMCKRVLQVADTFPELMRVPVLRTLLA